MPRFYDCVRATEPSLHREKSSSTRTTRGAHTIRLAAQKQVSIARRSAAQRTRAAEKPPRAYPANFHPMLSPPRNGTICVSPAVNSAGNVHDARSSVTFS